MTKSPLIFLGAGASAPFNVPTMKNMVNLFEKELGEKGQDNQIDLWNNVKLRLQAAFGVDNVDIEHMLTFFSSPIIDPSRLSPNVIYGCDIIEKNPIQVADPEIAKAITIDLKDFIYRHCDIQAHERIFPVYSMLWKIISVMMNFGVHEFYMSDLEVFTTNYDRCFEIFYNMARTRSLSSTEIVLDTGVKGRYYNPAYYGTTGPRLYKLHGSIRRYITRADMVRLYDGLRREGDPVNGDEVVKEWMIWPLTGKYIYQYPYSELMDKFRQTLYDRRLWLFVGFSFRDEGIRLILEEVNDRLKDQMRRGKRAPEKRLILVDRSADQKKSIFQKYEKIRFYPVTGEFGEKSTFDKLAEVIGQVQ